MVRVVVFIVLLNKQLLKQVNMPIVIVNRRKREFRAFGLCVLMQQPVNVVCLIAVLWMV